MYRAFILCVCLVWPAVSQATLTASLENPGNGGSVSGLSVISGWAFSDAARPLRSRSISTASLTALSRVVARARM